MFGINIGLVPKITDQASTMHKHLTHNSAPHLRYLLHSSAKYGVYQHHKTATLPTCWITIIYFQMIYQMKSII